MKLVAIGLLLCIAGCSHRGTSAGKRVIVLGVDGMDPSFVEQHWSALPNPSRLRDRGGLVKLATTTPPQSPVAWATFSTGWDPAQHGIFDFVHRDPVTMQLLSSMAETIEPQHYFRIGPYALPLSKARVRSLRAGRAFWEILAEYGIPVTVMRMPDNYPPARAGEALAGMGTPDLQGTFGTFTYHTDDPLAEAADVSGGRIVPVSASQGRVVLPIEGPPNSLRRDHRPARLELIADIDPDAPAMRCKMGEQQFVLKQGEWSPWIRVRFPLLGELAGTSGMFRLYARELHPGIRIYRSPLNVDPADPALPISVPARFSRDLSARVGPFYTQGIEEDTSALRQGALDLPEFLEQSRLVAAEHHLLLRDCMAHFHDGFLFFYFSEIDQNSHVLWGRHERELLATYQTVDREIGEVLAQAGNATVIVMSDHGFAAFNKSVNLNTWLLREGFLHVDAGQQIDWKNTQAYALGLNALYVKPAVLEKVKQRLSEFRDPETGQRVVDDISVVGASASRYAPTLIVGYAPGYRASWQTALGGVPLGVIEPNQDAWIGDHCIAAKDVPGVLMGTRRSTIEDPALRDLSVTNPE